MKAENAHDPSDNLEHTASALSANRMQRHISDVDRRRPLDAALALIFSCPYALNILWALSPRARCAMNGIA